MCVCVFYVTMRKCASAWMRAAHIAVSRGQSSMISNHNRRRRHSTWASRKKGKSRPINAHAYRVHACLDANQASVRVTRVHACARARALVYRYGTHPRSIPPRYSNERKKRCHVDALRAIIQNARSTATGSVDLVVEY